MMQEAFYATDDIVQSERQIHTPGAFARQNLLYVQEVGYLKSIRQHRCVREKINSFLLLIVVEGKGSIEIGESHFELERGCCAFIDCMEHFEHISAADDAWKLAWVHFNGETARAYYELFLENNKSNVFYAANITKWTAHIDKLIEQQKDKSFHAELRSGELLLALCNAIVSNIDRSEEADRKLANDIRIALNDVYIRQDAVSVLERKFKREEMELDAVFSKYYGIGIQEYISKRRFNRAKQLLRFSIKPLDDVLIESGIMDYRSMQSQFLAEEGMTAEEYRKKWAQWIRQ